MHPFVSTLNVIAVPVGTAAAIPLYATDSTQLILDVNGFFARMAPRAPLVSTASLIAQPAAANTAITAAIPVRRVWSLSRRST